MKSRYILDACALIAYINDEEGADTVESFLVGAILGDALISMSKINLLEVYYGVLRDFGLAKAEEVLNEILSLPIQIIGDLSDATFREAGRLKATYKISLADSLLWDLHPFPETILLLPIIMNLMRWKKRKPLNSYGFDRECQGDGGLTLFSCSFMFLTSKHLSSYPS